MCIIVMKLETFPPPTWDKKTMEMFRWNFALASHCSEDGRLITSLDTTCPASLTCSIPVIKSSNKKFAVLKSSNFIVVNCLCRWWIRFANGSYFTYFWSYGCRRCPCSHYSPWRGIKHWNRDSVCSHSITRLIAFYLPWCQGTSSRWNCCQESCREPHPTFQGAIYFLPVRLIIPCTNVLHHLFLVALYVFEDRYASRALAVRFCLFPPVPHFHHLRTIGLFHHQGLKGKKRAWELQHSSNSSFTPHPARSFVLSTDLSMWLICTTCCVDG